ncbi:MAG: hypothetical protein ABI240_07215 [Sphingomonas sp.]
MSVIEHGGWYGHFLTAAGLLFLATNPAEGQVFVPINFGDHPGPATFSKDGVEVTLQPTTEKQDEFQVSAAIRVPGFQSVIVREESGSGAGYDRYVGLGKLSATDPAASVIIQGFSGGAHCCATLQVVTPTAGKLKSLSFEPIDGEGMKSFPVDIDQDGTVDFVRQDDSFRYEFSSGAGSYSPPIIYNIYKGQIVDVTTQPGFRPLWERFAVQTRTACGDQANDDRNGACAAYVAAAARLGKTAAAMAEVEKLANQKPDVELPTRCLVALENYTCPAAKQIKFYTFKSALVWFLHEHGYTD